MRKKLFFSSILVLILLLLMPSITAIQLNLNEEKIYYVSAEQINFKNLKEIISSDDDVKHHLLYTLIFYVVFLRQLKGFGYLFFSSNYPGDNGLEIKNPIIYYRGLCLVTSTRILGRFLENLVNKMGWNWQLIIF